MMAGQAADALVARYILREFRSGGPHGDETADHLAGCPEAVVTSPDASDGTYGCDTGCSYVTFEALIACPHVTAPYEHSFGEFGELAWILEDIAEMDTQA